MPPVIEANEDMAFALNSMLEARGALYVHYRQVDNPGPISRAGYTEVRAAFYATANSLLTEPNKPLRSRLGAYAMSNVVAASGSQ